MFCFCEFEGLVERGKTFHDLGPCEKSDAPGVGVHYVFAEEGSLFLVEVELVHDSLPGWWLVFLLKHS